ncbi:TIGR03618 family F420-dependent PPOX class oxidoreductase [Nocardioides zeae]|uniref:TIGR03618 family F420-dependent PPOX class oxidoreductase n=1 Tax=Nocardioides imazamoxiresistens TaxID=3231893 RepID=A0ABU3PWM0_9ACTN|nr:TIGR03618 family F420-dependent PPOX class oxidoreductase [Nocardioides zeae]MDT9593630.1 TIGR03618 family F420-dependent PPOX class oxidoreductase [Nocardioides zeae]
MTSWTPGWDSVPEPLLAHLSVRRPATLTTLRADGRPHSVPVGVTLDVEERCAWVITFASSRKARNVLANPGGPVSVCDVERAVWATIEGTATATTEPAAVARAVERYALRYKQPKEREDRVAIRIEVDRILASRSLLDPA